MLFRLSSLFLLALSCVAAPLTVANVVASTTAAGSAAQNLINGSGLSGGLHSADSSAMWMSVGLPATVEFDLGSVNWISSISIWNYNLAGETDGGARQIFLSVSTDGISFSTLGGIMLAQGTGSALTGAEFALGAYARYINFNLATNYGDTGAVGLSEVQFASTPEPAAYLLIGAGLLAFGTLRIGRLSYPGARGGSLRQRG